MQLSVTELIKHHTIKTYGRVEVLDGGEWSASYPSQFTPATHLIGGWVAPGACWIEGQREKPLPLPQIKPWLSNM